MRKAVGLIVFLLAIGAAGCAEIREYVDMAGDKGVSKEYLNALNAGTRSRTVLSQFETKVVVSVTLKSADFRRAYQKEYRRLYPPPAGDGKGREVLPAAAADFTEFVFYANTPNDDANDFDRPNSTWTVFLRDAQGKRVDPLEIRRIDKITPVIQNFYPYIHPYYGKFYSLKFPLPSGDTGGRGEAAEKPCVLVFTGILANVELAWP